MLRSTKQEQLINIYSISYSKGIFFCDGQWCLKDKEINISPTARLRVLTGRNFDSNLLACVCSYIKSSKLIVFIPHLSTLHSV